MIYEILHTISQYIGTTPLIILKGDNTEHILGRAILVKVLLRSDHSYSRTAKILNSKFNKIKWYAERFKQNEYTDDMADIIYWQHKEDIDYSKKLSTGS